TDAKRSAIGCWPTRCSHERSAAGIRRKERQCVKLNAQAASKKGSAAGLDPNRRRPCPEYVVTTDGEKGNADTRGDTCTTKEPGGSPRAVQSGSATTLPKIFALRSRSKRELFVVNFPATMSAPRSASE